MSPVEWYYAQGDKQKGPVSPAEIKALADGGKLLPDDLVWREGMEEWIPARKVKGLFASEESSKGQQAAPTASPPGAGATGAIPPGAVPPGAVTAGAAPPLREGGAPVFEKSPAAFQRAREGSARHFFDFVLEFARGQFPGQFVVSTSRVFTVIGHYGLYAAMLLLLIISVVLGIKAKDLNLILMGLGGVVIMFVLQYAAGRFCNALARLNQGSPGQISSTAFLDCWALLSMALGVGALVGYSVEAIQTNAYLLILTGLSMFIVCEFIGFVSLNPETLKITLAPEIRAGEEAIGIVTFLLKLGLMLAPVAFGVGVAVGVVELTYCLILVFQQAKQLDAYLAATGSSLWIISFAALPLLAYIAFLVYYLLVDVIRAVLSMPGKLDKLAAGDEEDKEEG